MLGRIIRSFGADTLGQILNIGMRILLVPLFLSTWGSQGYGEWLVLTALAGWFSLGDLGGQLYFINRMTSDWASKSFDTFQKVYSTGLLLFLISSCVLFALVVIILPLLPLVEWLNFRSIDAELLNIILLIIALKFLLSLPLGLLLGVYRAIGLQATSVMYGNLILLIQLIASVIALLNNAGMLLLASIEVLPIVLIIPIVFWDLHRRLPKEIELFNFSYVDTMIIRDSVSPSLHFLSLQLSAAMIIQGSIIVMAKTLGPIEIAIFSSMRIIANVMSRVMGTISHAAWPELTRLAIQGKHEKLSKLFKIVLFLALFIGLCYLSIIVNFGESLFYWWLNDSLAYDNRVMFLLSSQVVLSVMWNWGGNLLMATNQHQKYARWQMPVNIIALLLCYLGSSHFGLSGGVMGLFLGQYLPMLGVVIWSLRQNGWNSIARDLVLVSIYGMFLVPCTLSNGLCLIVLSILLLLKKRVITRIFEKGILF